MKSSFLAAAALAGLANAHTWIEDLYVLKGGSYVGEPGYTRSYMPRDTPEGQDIQYLLENGGDGMVNPDLPVCNPNEQSASQKQMPRLKAAPGDLIAMRYLENGHVSLWDPNDIVAGKKKNSITYIYGAKKSVDGQKIGEVLKWKADSDINSGKLLTANTYDDGRCYEANGREVAMARGQAEPPMSVYCENDVKVPKDFGPGDVLTLYWVWDWPSFDDAGKVVKDQIYTSCIDIDIVAEGDRPSGPVKDLPGGNGKALGDAEARGTNQLLGVTQRDNKKEVGGGAPKARTTDVYEGDDDELATVTETATPVASTLTRRKVTRTVTSTVLTTLHGQPTGEA